MDIMKDGIDSVSFWNIWRLTPAVYRREEGKSWIVRREFGKLEEEGIRDRAEYVLDATINLFIVADQKLAATKFAERRIYYIDLKQDKVQVYQKASKESKVISITPENLTKIFVNYSVEALDGGGMFWRVSHSYKKTFISGFISEDVVQDST